MRVQQTYPKECRLLGLKRQQGCQGMPRFLCGLQVETQGSPLVPLEVNSSWSYICWGLCAPWTLHSLTADRRPCPCREDGELPVPLGPSVVSHLLLAGPGFGTCLSWLVHLPGSAILQAGTPQRLYIWHSGSYDRRLSACILGKDIFTDKSPSHPVKFYFGT